MINRILTFLVGCIGTRLGLVWLAHTLSDQWLYYMGALALIPATGFLLIYMFGLRKTGVEVNGDLIWWNELRPVHALLYTLFAFYAMNGLRSEATNVLLFDVLIGVTSWAIFRSFYGFDPTVC